MMLDRSLLYHQLDGDGEPLLLLNGIAMSVASWQPVAALLADRYRVIRCDLRGQLLSPGEPPTDVVQHAEDVVALLDHIGVDVTHILATSFGAAVGTLVAAGWPDRVRSCVSVASTDAFDDVMAVEVARWREACLQSLSGEDRGLISDVLETSVYSPEWIAAHRELRGERRRQIAALPDTWFRQLAGLLDSAPGIALRPELPKVRCPTLIIAAQLDRFIPLDRTRNLARGITGARFKVIEGAGHAVVVERPDELVDICLDFFKHVNSSF